MDLTTAHSLFSSLILFTEYLVIHFQFVFSFIVLQIYKQLLDQLERACALCEN